MGQLYVVGIGPGKAEGMTVQAEAVLADCAVIAGYTLYVDLIKERFPEKEYIITPMKQEKERCLMALKAAESGKATAVVCSGDAGVYGMAGLLFAMGQEFPEVEICVIPGVTAALSGAAVLGAPLGHDFAVISLSDLLTPWEVIEKRLRMAAEGDFAICLYNPSSHKRKDYLKRACEILLQVQSPDTVCGYVRNIGREGQEHKALTLGELACEQVDMFTTVFIGSSKTCRMGEQMVTPRIPAQ